MKCKKIQKNTFKNETLIKMPDYQNGKIYMVWFTNCETPYYGSTTNRLSTRLSQHKTQYKLKRVRCTLFPLFEKYGVDEAKIELIEAFPCNNRNELEAREGFYIRNNPHINRQVAGRSREEGNKIYKETHKEECKARDKAYYQLNKEKIKQRSKAYYEANKESQNEKSRQRYKKNHTVLIPKG
jgi:hypothetical protein